MSWINQILSSGVSTIIDSVGTAIDKLVTSDQERLEIKAKISKDINKHLEGMEDKILLKERELTIRHSNDMASDSWLSKNIRPILLIYLVFIISVLSILFRSVEEPTIITCGTSCLINIEKLKTSTSSEYISIISPRLFCSSKSSFAE